MNPSRFTLHIDSLDTASIDLRGAWAWIKAMLAAGHKLHMEIRKDTRTLAQSRLMWSCLTDISGQVQWPVNGSLRQLEPEEWKDLLTAGLKKEQQMAAGISGGWVMLGQRTSKMTKAELSELVELSYAFGAERGVKWSRTSLGREIPNEAMA